MAGKTPWEVLSKINVSDHIEKKNGLTYLSWAWAWGELKNHYPLSFFLKHTDEKGMPFFRDDQGFSYVAVSVHIPYDKEADNLVVTEVFPVLDHRNKSIKNPDSFDVNKAIQRCLAKAIAYHGLGHYIYAGEDLPETDNGVGFGESAFGLTLFKEFLPDCKTEEELRDFFNNNKSEIEKLKSKNKSEYDQIIKLFKEAKTKILGVENV